MQLVDWSKFDNEPMLSCAATADGGVRLLKAKSGNNLLSPRFASYWNYVAGVKFITPTDKHARSGTIGAGYSGYKRIARATTMDADTIDKWAPDLSIEEDEKNGAFYNLLHVNANKNVWSASTYNDYTISLDRTDNVQVQMADDMLRIIGNYRDFDGVFLTYNSFFGGESFSGGGLDADLSFRMKCAPTFNRRGANVWEQNSAGFEFYELSQPGHLTVFLPLTIRKGIGLTGTLTIEGMPGLDWVTEQFKLYATVDCYSMGSWFNNILESRVTPWNKRTVNFGPFNCKPGTYDIDSSILLTQSDASIIQKSKIYFVVCTLSINPYEAINTYKEIYSGATPYYGYASYPTYVTGRYFQRNDGVSSKDVSCPVQIKAKLRLDCEMEMSPPR